MQVSVLIKRNLKYAYPLKKTLSPSVHRFTDHSSDLSLSLVLRACHVMRTVVEDDSNFISILFRYRQCFNDIKSTYLLRILTLSFIASLHKSMPISFQHNSARAYVCELG